MRARGLEILVLGELTIVRDGRPLALPASKKTRALLGFLAATGRPQLRARLCELLWDGPDDPRAALRWSLAKLRPVLNEPAVERVVADRERVSFELRGAALDVASIRSELGGVAPARAATDALRRVAEMFRGDFLEGLDLPDCPRFHEWCQVERGELRRLRLAILAALVQREDHPDARVRHARMRVALDPYEEAAHVDLVSLLGKLGRPQEAIEQYEQCRRLLERELGVAPSPRLSIARAEVRVEAIARAARPSYAAPAEVPRPAGEVPFVGRPEALEPIAAAIAAAKATRSPGVLLVTGEPGIGKTRVLEEAARRTRDAGGLVLSACAFEVEMVRPYGLWIDAFRSAPAGSLPPWPSELSLLLPEITPPTQRSPVDRARLLEIVRHWVAELARRVGLLAIVLDDVHWIDDASAALVSLAARTTAGLVVVCAARSEEIDDNSAAVRLRRTLRRERRLVPVRLGPLDVESTTEIVRAIAKAVDAGRVHAESGGNPLFAIEIARSLAGGTEVLPETLRGIVEERFERLDAALGDALSWAAAFGKSFRPELLGAAAGIAGGELPGVVGELERRGFVCAARDGVHGEYDFSHEVIRRAAYLRLSEPRRRAIHRHIAYSLAAAAEGQPELAADVAHHAGLGGDDVLAARHYRFAAERCQLVFANAEAIALADRGLRHLAAVPEEKMLGLEVALRKVQVCSGAGTRRRAELEGALMRLAGDAQRTGAAADAAESLYVLSILHHDGGNFPGAEASILRAAEASRAADVPTRARSLANAGRCLAQIERDMAQAHAMLAEAQTLARDVRLDLTEIAWGLGVVRHFTGDHDEASALLERALAAARKVRDHWVECECLTRIIMIALERGGFEAALAPCAELADAAKKMGEGSEAPTADALLAIARAALGHRDAGEHIEAALGALRRMDAKGMLAYTLTFAAELDLDAGRLDSARRRAEEAVATAEALGRSTQLMIARSILARVLFAGGRTEEAAARVEAAAREPATVSGRARSMLVAAGNLVGMSIPAGVQTLVPTVGRYGH